MHEPDRKPLESDDDLIKRSQRDDYNINKIAKYTVLVLFVAACVVITVLVLLAVILNESWREFAIKAFFNNLPAILAVVLVVVGLRKRD